MSIFSKLTPLVKWIGNHKYMFVTIIFLVIVVLFDDKSMIKHFENRHKITTLEKEIAQMQRDSIETELKNSKIGPNGDIHEIEKICRDKYNMHTKDEDVFIIEE